MTQISGSKGLFKMNMVRVPHSGFSVPLDTGFWILDRKIQEKFRIPCLAYRDTGIVNN